MHPRAGKRRLSLLLVFSLLCTLLMPLTAFGVETAQFKDTADSYAQQEIQALADAGIISGYEDNTFRPRDAITRAELAKIIVLSLGLKENPEKAASFQDVGANAWHRGYVGALVESGITQGTSPTTFSPKNKVTREELAVFFIRAMGLEETAGKLEADATLADLNEVSDWAKAHVSLAFKIGFINGVETEGALKFSPKEYAERQALARLAYEFKTNGSTFVEKAKEIAGEKLEETANETPSTIPSSDRSQKFTVDSVQALDNSTVEVTLNADIKKTVYVKEFGIDGGLSIVNAEAKAGTNTVVLTTSPQTVGQTYKLSYNGEDTGKTFVGKATALSAIDASTYTGSFTVTKAGTFGPASGTAKIDGNLYVEAADVVLQNTVITGNLVLGEQIGEGDVTLKKVTVNGQTVVSGGGQNSIHLQDTVMVSIIVDKRTGAVRLVVEGETTVQQVTLQSDVILEESETLTLGGFQNVSLANNMPANSTVTLRGTFETVDVYATNIAVSIPSGFVNALNVRAEAANAAIDLGNATIASLVLDAIAAITGTGIVENAQINVSGTSFERMPNQVHLGEGVEGPGQSEPSENSNQLRYITVSNGAIGLTFNRTITDALHGDFNVSATLNGQAYQLEDLVYHGVEQKFTFKSLPADQHALKLLKITVAPAPSSTKFLGSKTAEITITGFEGTITDVDHRPVIGMTIKFRAGIGSTVGPVVSAVTTDANGRYKVTLPPGSYTGEISGDGFIVTYLVGVAATNAYNMSENATAIRIAAAEETRIVLVWGENPRDLDSHLVGPRPDAADEFHTWYGNEKYFYNSVLYDDLDLDDVSSYGPETTTIRHDVNGTYRFYVHHYSGSQTTRTSGAEVRVYRGNSTEPVRTYRVPAGEGSERYWAVFEMTVSDSGVSFTEINQLFGTETEARGPKVNVATVDSSIYMVNHSTGSISNVPAGTPVESFKLGLTPAHAAAFQVFEGDGVTVKTGTIASGDKVIVTAANGITKKTYTITVATVLPPATVTGLVYDSSVTVTSATYQFSLSANFSDGSFADVTNWATWTSSAANVATVNESNGLLTAVSNGSTVVSATYGGLTATFNVTVNAFPTVTMNVYSALTSGDASVTQSVYGPLAKNGNDQYVIPAIVLDSDLGYLVVRLSDTVGSNTVNGTLDFSQATVTITPAGGSPATVTSSVYQSASLVIQASDLRQSGSYGITISGVKKTENSQIYVVNDLMFVVFRE
ncbi:S-layer homology domain-containing protein [Paenibacillus alkalitolerans]|uniref:S-layer homology domain-containing protein n=1 Tax=Paenibacillus alkalitolerans TaxID=2799335 RepID=UPI0018F66F32|nr:S-layer homology domain-containing protein [Paenibacillus alkalitolerans]